MARYSKFIPAGAAVVIALVLLLAAVQQHVYFFQQVAPDQVVVKIRGGQIAGIVPPGDCPGPNRKG